MSLCVRRPSTPPPLQVVSWGSVYSQVAFRNSLLVGVDLLAHFSRAFFYEICFMGLSLSIIFFNAIHMQEVPM